MPAIEESLSTFETAKKLGLLQEEFDSIKNIGQIAEFY